MAPNLQDKSDFITQLFLYLCGINSMINYYLNSNILLNQIVPRKTSKYLVIKSLLFQMKMVYSLTDFVDDLCL